MVFLPQELLMRRSLKTILLSLSCALLLSACSSHHTTKSAKHTGSLDPFAGTGSPYYKGGGAIPFAGGRYQVGKPYQVAGRWFTPHEQPGYDKKGLASWYGEAFHRRKTSNGEYFDMNTLTAAHATLPLPSYAKVTNLENGNTVVVRINDRGPFVDTRVLDVSKRAADALGYRRQGTTHVRVQLIGPAPLKDSGGRQVLALNDALNDGASLNQLAALSQDGSASAPVQVAEAKPRRKLQAPVQQVAYEPPPQPPTDSSYVVRVAIFHDIENATAAYDQVSGFGPAQIIKAVGANGPLYRVQIGPLDNEQDAQSALETAIAAGFEDARIVAAQITQVSSN
jgi:rare lipoprotein A